MINRRAITKLLGIVAIVGAGWANASLALAADETPDELIKRLSTDVLNAIKGDPELKAGNLPKVTALVESKILPHVNFRRVTASAVGPSWLKATPEQQKELQEEFKTLLTRIYSGALTQITDHQIVVKPMRSGSDDNEVVVKSEIRSNKGEPIQLDYRLEKTPNQGSGWKIYNLNVGGVWLMENYRSQFAQEINTKGIDGLIASLKERNKNNAKKTS